MAFVFQVKLIFTQKILYLIEKHGTFYAYNNKPGASH